MSSRDININTRPVASQYDSPAEKTIEFSSPVGGGLVSFTLTKDDQLAVHVYRQDMTVQVTAGEAGEPVRHGNLRADAALYLAARAFVTDYEARRRFGPRSVGLYVLVLSGQHAGQRGFVLGVDADANQITVGFPGGERAAISQDDAEPTGSTS
jgi:hypothetical protein